MCLWLLEGSVHRQQCMGCVPFIATLPVKKHLMHTWILLKTAMMLFNNYLQVVLLSHFKVFSPNSSWLIYRTSNTQIIEIHLRQLPFNLRQLSKGHLVFRSKVKLVILSYTDLFSNYFHQFRGGITFQILQQGHSVFPSIAFVYGKYICGLNSWCANFIWSEHLHVNWNNLDPSHLWTILRFSENSFKNSSKHFMLFTVVPVKDFWEMWLYC